jgi:hypothetical protein
MHGALLAGHRYFKTLYHVSDSQKNTDQLVGWAKSPASDKQLAQQSQRFCPRGKPDSVAYLRPPKHQAKGQSDAKASRRRGIALTCST